MKELAIKLSFVLLCSVIGLSTYGQTISSFEFSRCMKEHVNDSSKIMVTDPLNNITEIQILTYGPCNGNFDSGLEL